MPKYTNGKTRTAKPSSLTKPPAGNVAEEDRATTQSTAEGGQEIMWRTEMEFRKRTLKESQEESAEKLKKEQTASADRKKTKAAPEKKCQVKKFGNRLKKQTQTFQIYLSPEPTEKQGKLKKTGKKTHLMCPSD